MKKFDAVRTDEPHSSKVKTSYSTVSGDSRRVNTGRQFRGIRDSDMQIDVINADSAKESRGLTAPYRQCYTMAPGRGRFPAPPKNVVGPLE